MIKETLGEKLRKAREAKKLTIRDVTRETNIIQRYIEALENNEFNKFPGETYLLGFLRNYGNFLKLDEDELLMLYKGQQISESQTPIEELTKPTSPFALENYIDKDKFSQIGKIVAFGVLLIVIFFLGRVIWQKIKEIPLKNISISANNKQNDKIPDFAQKKDLPFIRNKGEIVISKNDAVSFQINDADFAFQLSDILQDKVIIITYPGEAKVYLPLQKEIESLIPGCDNQLLFQLKALTKNSAKIELAIGKNLKTNVVDTANKQELYTSDPNSLTIKMHMELMDNSYIESYLDGKKAFAGLLKRGQEMNWTAKKTIQLYLGNAEGVKVTINGKLFSFKGKVVNKVFSWKKDPLDPTKYDISVNDN